jgi:hypothetical protein
LPGQLPGVVASEEEMATLGSQLSDAVAAPKVGTAGQLIGEVTEGHVIVGGVTSFTTMVRLHVAVFPQSSVAVHVRVIPPTQPGTATSLNVMATLGSHASDAVAFPNDGTAGHVIGDTTVGQVIVGGVMSRTLMVRLQVDVLPQSSVAVHVRVTL